MKSLIEIWGERQKVEDEPNAISRKEYLRMSRRERRALRLQMKYKIEEKKG